MNIVIGKNIVEFIQEWIKKAKQNKKNLRTPVKFSHWRKKNLFALTNVLNKSNHLINH